MQNNQEALLRTKETPEMIQVTESQQQISKRKIKKLRSPTKPDQDSLHTQGDMQNNNLSAVQSSLSDKHENFIMDQAKISPNKVIITRGDTQTRHLEQQHKIVDKQHPDLSVKKQSGKKNPFDSNTKKLQNSSKVPEKQQEPSIKNPFLKPEPRKPINIFAKTKDTINLFEPRSITQPPPKVVPSITVFMQNKLAKEAQDSDNQSLLDLDEPKEPEANPKLSSGKYVYKKQHQKLFECGILKFRRDNLPMLTDVTLSIETPIEGQKQTYLVVRDTLTKLIKYQAIVLKDKMNIQIFMGKEQNVKFNVWKVCALQEEITFNKKKLLTKQTVKIQFGSAEEANKFKQQFV